MISDKLRAALHSLNPEQKSAVEIIDRPGLILSGAGSGKTKVITTRIAYLSEVHRIASSRILALTFTNKAAREMKQRARKLTAPGTETPFIGTFHSLCLEILKIHAGLLGYGKDFIICDAGDQQKILKEIFAERNWSDGALMKPSEVGFAIGNAKRNLQTPEFFLQQKDNLRAQVIGEVFKNYNENLKNRNMMDFDDLLNHTQTLFSGYREKIQSLIGKYSHILVDEYQDTSPVQYQIVRSLIADSPNLFLVGDDDQSIYSWRGADIRNIFRFQEDFPNAAVIRLERNYRSVPTILEAANAVIAKNSERMKKNLWAEGKRGELIDYFHADDEAEEMEYIFKKMRRLKERKNLNYSDFAFLYRTNHHSRSIEESLRNESIPYRLIGATKFFDREEIKNALAYLRLASNPADGVSFLRVINFPRRGIGEQTLKQITASKKKDQSYLERIADADLSLEIGNRPYGALIEFRKTILRTRERLKKESFAQVFKELFEELQIENEIFRSEKNETTANNKVKNLREFVRSLFLYEKKNSKLVDFLRYTTLFAEDSENKDQVQLMTVHSAKGLEFECVILCGLGDEDFPNARAVEENSIEEERRLFYVAITRAKQNLILTHPKQKFYYGKSRYIVPSRFLDEIPPNLLSGKIKNQTDDSRQREEAEKTRSKILKQILS